MMAECNHHRTCYNFLHDEERNPKNKTKKHWNVHGSKDDKPDYNEQYSGRFICFLAMPKTKCVPGLRIVPRTL